MTAHVKTTSSFAPFAAAADALRRFGRRVVESSDAMHCSRNAERLFAMSDAELAKEGLTRDRIVHHVFARYLAS